MNLHKNVVNDVELNLQKFSASSNVLHFDLIFQVPKDNPALRVLFHLGNHHNVVGRHKICILLTASVKAKRSKQDQDSGGRMVSQFHVIFCSI